jgi:hypothetical protein
MTVTPPDLRRHLAPAALLLLLLAAAGLAQTPAPAALVSSQAAPRVLPTAALPDVEARLAFLRTAKVVSSRLIGKGVTGALRVTLSDGTLTHDAAFQAVTQESFGAAVPQRLRRPGESRFVDHYRYNIAAWRLAGLLGLAPMMPPTIERRIDGRMGALSWWVDDVLMDEQEREAKGAQPPDSAVAFARQRQSMWIFAELVRDTDRNKGNVVYTKDWRVVMLDFTRAFRLQRALTTPAALNGCARGLLERLRALTEDELKTAVEDHLTGGEIDSVMARRDLLVGHFDRLIATRGEAAVLY